MINTKLHLQIPAGRPLVLDDPRSPPPPHVVLLLLLQSLLLPGPPLDRVEHLAREHWVQREAMAGGGGNTAQEELKRKGEDATIHNSNRTNTNSKNDDNSTKNP